MDFVPNAAFDATFPIEEEYDHPPGCYLARRLEEELRRTAFSVDEFDNWRDCGWVVYCAWDDAEFEVYFVGSPVPNASMWILGIAPIGQPGLIRRLFGAKPFPYLKACRELTQEVRDILEQDHHISNLRWAANADPRKSDITDPDEMDWPDAVAT